MKGSSLSVLIVDDFKQWRSVVRTTLHSRLGVNMFEEAEDGLEAVHKSSHLRPDLVVLDIGLPGLNGFEVARQIRTISPKSKVVFLTENASYDLGEASFNSGAKGYVTKSAFAKEFIPTVEAVLAGRQSLAVELKALPFRPAWT